MLLLLVVGKLYLGLQRGWNTIIFCIFVGILIEFFCIVFIKPKRIPYHFWFPSITSSVGVILLVYSTEYWIYGLLSFLAIVSKNFIKKKSKHPIFNPINFAIVMFLAVMPKGLITLVPDRFSISQIAFWYLLIIGTITTYFVNRWMVVISYILSFAIFTYFITFFNIDFNYFEIIGPELSSAGLFFIFFMLADTASSAKKKIEQIFFGFLVASICIILRANYYYFNRFVALLAAELIFHIYKNFNWKFLSIKSSN